MIFKFVPGRTYYTRSACNQDTIFTVRIISRTAKTIKAQIDGRGEPKTLRISEYADRSGLDVIEQVKPHGAYSMAPIVGADREQAPPVAGPLSPTQALIAQELRKGRPAVLPGTNVIVNDVSRVAWYNEVTRLMSYAKVYEPAAVNAFCDLAGVPS
jgi:hypothetical protein